MRIIGLDVSRSVAEIAYLEDGVLRAGGRTGLRRDELERFAARLGPDDHVVLEATGNTTAIVNVLRAHAGQPSTTGPVVHHGIPHVLQVCFILPNLAMCLINLESPVVRFGFVGYPRRARALATRSETASP